VSNFFLIFFVFVKIFFNVNNFKCERPWSPAKNEMANECKLCECNGHADQCLFNSTLYLKTNKTSGGVCVCKHNTIGINCEHCASNYCRDLSLPFSHPESCKSKLFLFFPINVYLK
jgi:netrin 1